MTHDELSSKGRCNMKRLRLFIIAVTIALMLAATVRPTTETVRAQATKKAPEIKVGITTGGQTFGPPRNHFRTGEQVPVVITMTNISTEPFYVCVSSPLYQDLPTLTRNGRHVPYMNWQAYELATSKKDRTCANLSLPEPALLPPNQTTVVDWLILSDDASLVADGWYDPLRPGHYQLSLQRRLDCCDGPMIESNTTDFEVER